MADHSRTEAAARAGLEARQIDRLIELRIIAPDADDRLAVGEIRKAQLAQTLADAGVSLEALSKALDDGLLTLAFLDTPAYERFATLSGETFEELSQRTGIPFALLCVVREATGAATPDPGDLVREDELAIVPLIEVSLAMGFRPRSIERKLRVLGDSLRRVSETESDAWRADVMEPMLGRRFGAAEQAAIASSEETNRLTESTDDAVLAMWHAQQMHSWTANIIDLVEISLAEAGLFTKLERPPAICFLDLVGYTRLTHERGDVAAADLAEALNRLVTNAAIEQGGRPVKWLGDGVMVYFPDPAPGVLAALEMVDGVRSAGLPPAHVGMHAGPVLFQEGDYFGQTVNLASRIAEYARPNELLVTGEVVEVAGDIGASFTEIGPVELKGISGAVSLHTAHRSTA